jgi:hypothetical protein
LHARLRVPQAGDEFRDLVPGKLTAFSGFGALRDFDFEFFSVSEVLGGNAEACAGYLLDLVVEQRGRTVDGGVDSRIFAAFTSVRTRTQHIHGFGDGLVRLWRKRAERHRAGHEGARDCLGRRDLVDSQFGACGAHFKQVAQI